MTAMIQAVDVELPLTLASAVAGDDVAFARIVARYQEELFAIAVATTPTGR
jgi:hypothetical protein